MGGGREGRREGGEKEGWKRGANNGKSAVVVGGRHSQLNVKSPNPVFRSTHTLKQFPQ